MARHTGKLTKRVVEAWLPSEGDPILWDGALPGFGIKANRTSKVYILNYRNKYNRERRYSIGRHGKLTTEQARMEAAALLEDIRRGGDPLGERKADKEALSVNQLLDRYLESAAFAEKAESTRYNDTGRINRHLRPTLGDLKVKQLTAESVRKAFAAIRDGKTSVTEKTKPRGKAIVRGGEGAARMAIRNLRAILNWAIDEGLASTNPAAGVEIGTDGNRDTVLETPEQYTALFRALDTLESHHRIPSAAADAIRVLAFTGARRNEIAALRWRYVDLKRGFITLPPKAHKSGHKSGKPKQIALPSPASVIIANRPQGGPDDYVFPPSQGEGPITLSSKLWELIRAEAGLPDGITNHALRHSLGSLMAIQGAQAPEIMATLGHKQLSTTQRYIHLAEDARTIIANKHTGVIAGALAGTPKAPVIDFKGGSK